MKLELLVMMTVATFFSFQDQFETHELEFEKQIFLYRRIKAVIILATPELHVATLTPFYSLKQLCCRTRTRNTLNFLNKLLRLFSRAYNAYVYIHCIYRVSMNTSTVNTAPKLT